MLWFTSDRLNPLPTTSSLLVRTSSPGKIRFMQQTNLFNFCRIGVDIGPPPNGGGGGSGLCKNVTVRNVHIIDANVPIYLTSK